MSVVGSYSASGVSAAPPGVYGGAPAQPVFSAPLPPENVPSFTFDGCAFELAAVVASCTVQPVPTRIMFRNSPRWEECLRRMLPYQGAVGVAGFSSYEPALHPARAVTFGDGVLALIYPTGRVVAFGFGKSEAVVAHEVKLAVLLLRLVAGNEVTILGNKGQPTIEHIVALCRTPHPALVACLRSDVLFLEKLALRHPDAVEVCRFVWGEAAAAEAGSCNALACGQRNNDIGLGSYNCCGISIRLDGCLDSMMREHGAGLIEEAENGIGFVGMASL